MHTPQQIVWFIMEEINETHSITTSKTSQFNSFNNVHARKFYSILEVAGLYPMLIIYIVA